MSQGFKRERMDGTITATRAMKNKSVTVIELSCVRLFAGSYVVFSYITSFISIFCILLTKNECGFSIILVWT